MKPLLPILLLIASLSCYGQATRQTTQKPNYDSLRIVLEEMVYKDQNIRRILIDSVGLDSPHAGTYIKQMQQIDADNQIKLKVILDKYGWIEQSKIGNKAAEAFFYIVQHSGIELMENGFRNLKDSPASVKLIRLPVP